MVLESSHFTEPAHCNTLSLPLINVNEPNPSVNLGFSILC